MRLIDDTNAEAFLRERGWIAPADAVEVRRLSGGVSNEVLLVRFVDRARPDFVLKQARPQLRVADPWFCGVERIWREVEVLRICESLLSKDMNDGQKCPSYLATTPKVLFEDRENYCFAMTAAPEDHRVWKTLLLAGEADKTIATACGRLLGALHARSWRNEDIARRLDDRQVFDELRLDPYYRTVAARRPDAAPHMERLIESVWQHRLCLVHADFSPKNLLTWPGGMMMVDFETGHYGDPAFDIGFFLSHLVLKAYFRWRRSEQFVRLADAFWSAYAATMQSAVSPEDWRGLAARGMQNLAGCAWARLDGKSPVEYLTDKLSREVLRTKCLEVFEKQPEDWPSAKWLVMPIRF